MVSTGLMLFNINNLDDGTKGVLSKLAGDTKLRGVLAHRRVVLPAAGPQQAGGTDQEPHPV